MQQHSPPKSAEPEELDEARLARIDAGIALLLPAVQAAREAARPATVRNANLTTPREISSGV